MARKARNDAATIVAETETPDAAPVAPVASEAPLNPARSDDAPEASAAPALPKEASEEEKRAAKEAAAQEAAAKAFAKRMGAYNQGALASALSSLDDAAAATEQFHGAALSAGLALAYLATEKLARARRDANDSDDVAAKAFKDTLTIAVKRRLYDGKPVYRGDDAARDAAIIAGINDPSRRMARVNAHVETYRGQKLNEGTQRAATLARNVYLWMGKNRPAVVADCALESGASDKVRAEHFEAFCGACADAFGDSLAAMEAFFKAEKAAAKGKGDAAPDPLKGARKAIGETTDIRALQAFAKELAERIADLRDTHERGDTFGKLAAIAQAAA